MLNIQRFMLKRNLRTKYILQVILDVKSALKFHLSVLNLTSRNWLLSWLALCLVPVLSTFYLTSAFQYIASGPKCKYLMHYWLWIYDMLSSPYNAQLYIWNITWKAFVDTNIVAFAPQNYRNTEQTILTPFCGIYYLSSMTMCHLLWLHCLNILYHDFCDNLRHSYVGLYQ